jgi:hypothetical protein
VHESEYKIRLSRQTVRHGRVVVELRNLGQDPHDLVVSPASGSGPSFSFGVSAPGSRRAKVLRLAAGRWILYCSLPGHEQLGMKATIAVR